MAISQNPIAALDLAIPDELRRRPIRLSLLKRAVRLAFHVFVLYLVIGFASDTLPVWLTSKTFRANSASTTADAVRFLFSHLIVLSVAPALLAGLLLNAKFEHGVARIVWVVPVVILLLAFLFSGHGIYLTMIWDSDFGEAFRYFFGAIHFTSGSGTAADVAFPREVIRAYTQLRFAVPAYAGIGYSLGAAIGMSAWCRALQRALTKV
jgi:hypothetical protein